MLELWTTQSYREESRRASRKNRGTGDPTLADSANARKPVARVRKSRSSKPVNMNSQSEVPDHWEDVEDDEPEDDGVLVKSVRSGRRRSVVSKGIRYPPELWYFVAVHVEPEDVSVFASICRDSYRATLTHKFWKRLYWKWCCPPPPPIMFFGDPEWLHERRGCRAEVIRTLHRRHRPLQQRATRRVLVGGDVSSLVGGMCLTLGRCPSTDSWVYCFIFRRTVGNFHRKLAPATRKDISKAREELFHNEDEGTSGLLVRANATSQLPAVFGHVLQNATITMTTGMQMKLSMVFTQTGYREGGSKTPASYHTKNLVLAPVKSYRVLRWWDEEFYDVFRRSLPGQSDS